MSSNQNERTFGGGGREEGVCLEMNKGEQGGKEGLELANLERTYFLTGLNILGKDPGIVSSK